MKKDRTSPALSYLSELSIAMLFFTISMCIIVLIFTAAAQKQRDSIDLDNALLISQSVIADLKSAEDINLHGFETYSSYIQKDSDGEYAITWSLEVKEGMLDGAIEIWKQDACLLHMPFAIKDEEALL